VDVLPQPAEVLRFSRQWPGCFDAATVVLAAAATPCAAGLVMALPLGIVRLAAMGGPAAAGPCSQPSANPIPRSDRCCSITMRTAGPSIPFNTNSKGFAPSGGRLLLVELLLAMGLGPAVLRGAWSPPALVGGRAERRRFSRPAAGSGPNQGRALT